MYQKIKWIEPTSEVEHDSIHGKRVDSAELSPISLPLLIELSMSQAMVESSTRSS